MTRRLTAGPPATPGELAAARKRHQLVKEELPRVRAAALAWRNGVAGLLAGLLGFGLIRGRNDVRDLAAPYDVLVGLSLLAALVAGTLATLLLLRAAHGRPAAVAVAGADPGREGGPLIGLDHIETISALRALRVGLVLSIACGGLLCAAVATTWYGPGRKVPEPRIEVLVPVGARCGQVVRVSGGHLTLATDAGLVVVDLAKAIGLRSVAECRAPQ